MAAGVKRTAAATAVSFVLLAAAFGYAASALDRAMGLRPFVSKPASQILCAVSILVGVFWISWAYSFLMFVGKGLPLEAFGRAVRPTRFLVTTGPYAYTRNPVIFGLLFVLLGVALLQGSMTGLVLIPIIALISCLYLLVYEEKSLRERFGADYVEYRRCVSILIPRMTPYVHTHTTVLD